MAKKLDVREYQCELIKVVDGDTIDCYIDLGFNMKTKKRVRYMGIDTWESRTRDLEEKKKGLAAKARNKELLEAGVFKLKSFGTGKFGRVLGEIFVSPDYVESTSMSVLIIQTVHLIYHVMVGLVLMIS